MQPLDEITNTMNQVLQCLLHLTGIVVVFIPKALPIVIIVLGSLPNLSLLVRRLDNRGYRLNVSL